MAKNKGLRLSDISGDQGFNDLHHNNKKRKANSNISEESESHNVKSTPVRFLVDKFHNQFRYEDKENIDPTAANRPAKRQKECPSIVYSGLSSHLQSNNQQKIPLSQVSLFNQTSRMLSQEDQISSSDEGDMQLERDLLNISKASAEHKALIGIEENNSTSSSSSAGINYGFNSVRKNKDIEEMHSCNSVNDAECQPKPKFSVSDLVRTMGQKGSLAPPIKSSLSVKKPVTEVLRDFEFQAIKNSDSTKLLKSLYFPYHFVILRDGKEASFEFNSHTYYEKDSVGYIKKGKLRASKSHFKESFKQLPFEYGEQNLLSESYAPSICSINAVTFGLYDLFEKFNERYNNHCYVGQLKDSTNHQAEIRGTSRLLSNIGPTYTMLKYKQISLKVFFAVLKQCYDNRKQKKTPKEIIPCYLVKFNVLQNEEFRQKFCPGCKIQIYDLHETLSTSLIQERDTNSAEMTQNNGSLKAYYNWSIISP